MGILAPSFPTSVHAYNCPSQCHTVNPGESIQQAINAAKANDTIFVSGGVFKERVTVNKTGLHLVGSGMSVTILDGQGQGSVVRMLANRTSITGFTLENSGPIFRAIRVYHVRYVNVTGNTLTSDLSSGLNAAGIDISLANHTLVDGNVFVNNQRAFNISRSFYNEITNNRIVSGNNIGLRIADASNNTIFQNVFVSGAEGMDVSGSLSRRNNFTRNLIRGMNITGVFLLDLAAGNIFNENTFMLNHIGVDFQGSAGNIFFHNSFLRSDGNRHVNFVFPSDVNTWDNHTLSAPRPGGNYWDNYSGVDTNGDGIGDTLLPANGVDNFPLTSPFVPVTLAVVGITVSRMSGVVPFNVSFTADVLGSLRPFSYVWNFGDNTRGSNETSPSHVFSVVGNHNVTVLVKDSSNTYELGSVMVVAVHPSQGLNTFLVGLIVLLAGGAVLGLVYYRRRLKRKSRDSASGNVKGASVFRSSR